MLVTAIYAVIAEPLSQRLRFADRWSRGDVLFAPPLFLAAAFGLVAVVRAILLILPNNGYTLTRFGEWAELCFSGAVLVFLTLVLRILRSPMSTGSGRSVPSEVGRGPGDRS